MFRILKTIWTTNSRECPCYPVVSNLHTIEDARAVLARLQNDPWKQDNETFCIQDLRTKLIVR